MPGGKDLQALNNEQRETLQMLKRAYQEILQALQHARTDLNLETIRSREDALPTYSQQVRAMDDKLTELRKHVSGLLTVDTNRTKAEDQFMRLLEGRQEHDFTQLFLQLPREREVELAEVLDLLRDLFKKGQTRN